MRRAKGRRRQKQAEEGQEAVEAGEEEEGDGWEEQRKAAGTKPPSPVDSSTWRFSVQWAVSGADGVGVYVRRR